MSGIDVSLVMPVWRTPQAWLEAAVRSALDDDGSLELIVVDDGNDAPVEPRLAHLGDPRLRVLRIAHGGQGAALEAGIAASRGAWLRFVDADDVVVADSTSLLLERGKGRDDLIPYGATVVCDEGLRPLHTISSDVAGDAVVACLLGRFAVRHVAMLFPRRIVERAGTWSSGLRVSGDWDFVLRALEHAHVEGGPEPVVHYRKHASSLTGAAGVEAGERDRELLIARFLDRNPRYRGTPVERHARAALLFDRAAAYANVGDAARALDRLGRGARLAPRQATALAPRVLSLLARRAPRRLGSHLRLPR